MTEKYLLKNTDQKKKLIKLYVYFLGITAIALFLYLVLLPFYPAIKYRLVASGKIGLDNGARINANAQDTDRIREITDRIAGHLPDSEYSVSANRIIIPKIGVNAPIVESESSEYGLSKGSWRVPESSTPDKGSNTVITGHRFKYLPPNNLTFYLFHKLLVNDKFSVIWDAKNYLYNIKEIKTVPATDLSIMDPTDEAIVTLFTCDPIYSTKNRLVVIGELIEEGN